MRSYVSADIVTLSRAAQYIVNSASSKGEPVRCAARRIAAALFASVGECARTTTVSGVGHE